jgi:betaine-aldehyde dehydrogenase
MGPLVSRTQHDKVGYIEAGKQEVLCLPAAAAFAVAARVEGGFVEPTVFTGVTDTMRIAREEISACDEAC